MKIRIIAVAFLSLLFITSSSTKSDAQRWYGHRYWHRPGYRFYPPFPVIAPRVVVGGYYGPYTPYYERPYYDDPYYGRPYYGPRYYDRRDYGYRHDEYHGHDGYHDHDRGYHDHRYYGHDHGYHDHERNHESEHGGYRDH